MINFYIPGLIRAYDLNINLIKLLKDKPQYFYDNIQIKGVYGAILGCIWNGGRTETYCNDFIPLDKVIKSFNDLDVSIRYTFTNSDLEPKHLSNFQGNMMMTLANNGMNDVIINSPILENYLRNKYPNFKYISSITKCIFEEKDIREEIKHYDFVVIDQKKNHDFKFLQTLDNSKIELLVNSYCFPECPYKKLHYKSISTHQLALIDDPFNTKVLCKRAKNFNEILNFSTTINNKELYEIYYKKFGISNFKLEGRSNSYIDILNNYLYYLTKPEYYDIIKEKLLFYCK